MNIAEKNLVAYIDKLMKPSPPDRIHNWQHSQLSIARYYGGCSYLGARYAIAYNEEGSPLVRIDVIEAKAKSEKAAKKAKRKTDQQKAIEAQGSFE